MKGVRDAKGVNEPPGDTFTALYFSEGIHFAQISNGPGVTKN